MLHDICTTVIKYIFSGRNTQGNFSAHKHNTQFFDKYMKHGVALSKWIPNPKVMNGKNLHGPKLSISHTLKAFCRTSVYNEP